jgi:hypothetical protein
MADTALKNTNPILFLIEQLIRSGLAEFPHQLKLLFERGFLTSTPPARKRHSWKLEFARLNKFSKKVENFKIENPIYLSVEYETRSVLHKTLSEFWQQKVSFRNISGVVN